MSILEVRVPNIGVEGEVEIVELCVSVGDVLNKDDVIIVVESDKATVEVPCPSSGSIESISISKGDKVTEGDLILTMDASEAVSSAISNSDPEEKVAKKVSDSLSDAKVDAQGHTSSEARLVDILIPDLGGSENVEVIEVLFSEGDEVSVDQTLVVLESDKATMEIPAVSDGVIQQVNVKVGSKVSANDSIGSIKISAFPDVDNEAMSADSATNPEKLASTETSSPQTSSSLAVERNKSVADSGKKVHAGPAVRKFAREHGVTIEEVVGTGPKGRILKEDLRDYIKSKVIAAQQGGGGAGLPSVDLPDFSAFGEVQIRQMDRIQKVTAENMQRSWLNVPHVTQFDEADITDLEVFRKEQKADMEARGVKLTPVAFILKACAYVLEKLPQFNVAIDMQHEKIVEKKYIHIGLAVDTPAGLVVPVIRNVNKKSLWDIAQECQNLAQKAKDKSLSPQDMQGGCFTISSLGGVGGTAFTPIVNTPEVAILGVSRSQMKPIWDGKEAFVPRLMLPLSLSYDHRAVNGADAARFTNMLSNLLGDIRKLLL